MIAIPCTCGVYIIHIEEDIYIGSSKNIRKRLQHVPMHPIKIDICLTDEQYQAELLESFLIYKMRCINKVGGCYECIIKQQEKKINDEATINDVLFL